MKIIGGLSALLIASLLAFAIFLASGPDYPIEFHRSVETFETQSVMATALGDSSQWPKWFHGLKQVEGSDHIKTGDELTLKIEPVKKEWKRFSLKVRVEELIPGSRLRLRVLEDSSGKLTQLFDDLVWNIEIQRGRVAGGCDAKTKHWRSRLFGRLTQRILMNQVFYPDLIALSRITQPVNQFLETSP